MNVHEIRRYRMLKRVRDFGARYRHVFAPIARAQQMFAAVDEAISAVDAHATSQASSRLDAREHTVAKAIAREALLEGLAALRRTVRACAPGNKSLHSRFQLPRGVPDRMLAACARALVEAAAPLEDELVAHAMPAAWMKELKAAIDSFEQAMHDRHMATGAHVGARVGIETAVAKGFAAVQRLDAIVANQMHDSPEPLCAWKRARRVERSPRPRSVGRRLVAALAVPQRQPFAAAQQGGSVADESGQQPHEIPGGMRPHFAA